MFRSCLIGFATLFLVSPASAGTWADGLFEELAKNFGSVPRGPTLAHPFRLTNSTNQPVHISGVRVSCGCVSASALQTTLAPGESTAIQAHMDTRRFLGNKSVTIFVTFDQPNWEEVRLQVTARSHDDLIVSPEGLNFGQVKQGSKPSASVTVTFIGTSTEITKVEQESNYIQTEFKETRREGGEIAYQVTANIRSDAPVGHWYSEVWLTTNNANMSRIRVPLDVAIVAPVQATPTSVQLGEIKVGTTAKRMITVRASQPFQITKVEGSDAELAAQDATNEAKDAHVLTLTVKPTKIGDVARKLKVVTDLKEDGTIEIEARGKVVP